MACCSSCSAARRFSPSLRVFCLLAVASLHASSTRGDDASLAELKRQIQRAVDVDPARVGIESFVNATHRVDGELSAADIAAGWKFLLQVHVPPIAKSDLLDLLEARRAVFNDVRVLYEVRKEQSTRGNDPDGPDVAMPFQSCEFLRESGGARILYRRADGDSKGNILKTVVLSYDGSVVRRLMTRRQKENAGSVESFRGRSQFVDFRNPIASSMMVNSSSMFGRPIGAYDIHALVKSVSSLVFRSNKESDGVNCIVVSNGIMDAYLSPEKDYATVRLDTFHTDNTRGEYVRRLAAVREFYEFADFGAGVLLAHRIVERSYSGDEVTRTVTTTISQASIPDVVADSTYTDIFPQGTLVVDSLKNTTYRLGVPSTAEDLELVRGWGKLRVSLVVLNIVAVVVLVLLVLRRRFQQRVDM